MSSDPQQFFPQAPLLRSLIASTPVVLGAALAAALTGIAPPLVGTAVAAGYPSAVFTFLLIRLALRMAHGPCRGAGFLSMGVLVSGLGAVVAPVLPERLAALAFPITLCLSTPLYLLGILMLPGTAPDPLARLRRTLDGIGIGTSLFLTCWLLVIIPLGVVGSGPRGMDATIALTACVTVTAAIAVTLITGIRAVRYRRAAVGCAAGVTLALVGHGTLTMSSLVGWPVPALLIGSSLAATGASVIWLGARASRNSSLQAASTTPESVRHAGLPALAVPVGLAVGATLYHLVTVGYFGRYTAALGVLVIASIAVREAFSAYDMRRYARKLAGQEARFRAIVAGSTDVTIVLDEDLMVRWQSPSAARQLGLSDQDVVGRPFTEMLHPDDTAEATDRLVQAVTARPSRPILIDSRIKDGYGQWRDTESTVSDQRDVPEVAGLVVHIRDVGERKDLERTLHRMAFTDPLTGLPNRRQLLRRLEEARRAAGERGGTLLTIDIDGFTAFNESRGQDVGDALLIEVAARMRQSIGRSDVAARLLGDEFAVLTVVPESEARGLATRLLTILAEPYELPESSTGYLTASIGLAAFTVDSDIDEIMRNADLALRQAKQLGKNRIERYDEALEYTLVRRSALEQELRGATGRDELDLAYQVVVELTDRRPVGVEALLRWRHPMFGTVGPEDVISVAEEARLIDEVGGWVLTQACRRLAGWLADGHEVWLSVNVSARQLESPGFTSMVANLVDAYQLPPGRLVLELAGRAPADRLQRITGRLAELRSLGVRTALDGFGASPTPLADLRRLPLDILKIDRSLTAEPGTARAHVPLADVVVRLGRRLGMEVIATGVEDAAQLDSLQAAGCRYGQGYLFGRPLPAEHTEALLDAFGGSQTDASSLT